MADAGGDGPGGLAGADEQVAARRSDNGRAGVLSDHQPVPATGDVAEVGLDEDRRVKRDEATIDGQRPAGGERYAGGGHRTEGGVVDRRRPEEDERAVAAEHGPAFGLVEVQPPVFRPSDERSLVDAFARHGLKRIGARGEQFDPKVHQAVAQAPGDQPAGTIQEVLQSGYVLGDRTLRAAMVLVSVGPASGAPAPHVDIKV